MSLRCSRTCSGAPGRQEALHWPAQPLAPAAGLSRCPSPEHTCSLLPWAGLPCLPSRGPAFLWAHLPPLAALPGGRLLLGAPCPLEGASLLGCFPSPGPGAASSVPPSCPTALGLVLHLLRFAKLVVRPSVGSFSFGMKEGKRDGSWETGQMLVVCREACLFLV